jgi:cysteine-rich repeat protein
MAYTRNSACLIAFNFTYQNDQKACIQPILFFVIAFYCLAFASYSAKAAIPDQNGTFWGCVKKTTGALRIIDNSVKNCKSGETKINWNQKATDDPQSADPITDLAQLNEKKCSLNGVLGKISLSYTAQGLAQLTCVTSGQFVCGDGVLGFGEQCDDGNTVNGDGCSQCLPDSVSKCGDGVNSGVEQCDDGNALNGDGCSANCTTEVSGFCGDGFVGPGEQCDDGNKINNDGCSATCQR